MKVLKFGGTSVGTPCRLRRVVEIVQAAHRSHRVVVVASAAAGVTDTLGRGGSDYTAARIAGALKADVLERWTDVDGLYTDDPRKNLQARRLEAITLEEARTWSRAGLLGMHRQALDPLVAAGIPVHVRATAHPEAPGTLLIPAKQHDGHAAAIP